MVAARWLIASMFVAACSSEPNPPNPTGIGPAGGLVRSADGLAVLEVPAGALTAAVDLTLAPATGTPLDPSGTGAVYAVLPAGTVFLQPAKLSVRYPDQRRPSGVPEAELAVQRLEGATWMAPAPTVTVAATDSSATTVTRTGTYAVRWPGPSAACPTAPSRQFDFWLGTWAFSAPSSSPGTNRITVDATGCVISEDFVDQLGTRGASLSLYDPTTQQWHQTYVDSQNGRLVLKGGLVNGSMILNETATSRFGWTKLSDQQIRYYAETSSNGGASWTVIFDGRYTKAP
jgi:hypothetical protein